jgi:hypothetical protein
VGEKFEMKFNIGDKVQVIPDPDYNRLIITPLYGEYGVVKDSASWDINTYLIEMESDKKEYHIEKGFLFLCRPAKIEDNKEWEDLWETAKK